MRRVGYSRVQRSRRNTSRAARERSVSPTSTDATCCRLCALARMSSVWSWSDSGAWSGHRVVVRLGQTLALDLALEVGGLTEEVRVTAETPLLQTTNAEISDVIGNTQVVQIPLNGRNFLALAQLSDAVVLPPGGTSGDALQQAGPLPNVGGQRSGHNIYLLDGVKVTDELFNNLVINPSVDSIQEFKIQKSQYPAEFGGKASALINVATRAGGNAFHGSLFEFLRHDRFDARNYFDPQDRPVPPLRQNQFGGALGGPIVRDRAFFFGSYEGHRMRPVVDAHLHCAIGRAATR